MPPTKQPTARANKRKASALPGLVANKTPRNKKKRDIPPFPLLPPPVQHKKQKVVASDDEDEVRADGTAALAAAKRVRFELAGDSDGDDTGAPAAAAPARHSAAAFAGAKRKPASANAIFRSSLKA